MSETSAAILIMAAVSLLPLIPAFLLFKLLPSTGGAEGPMGGLTVKFGGAFAGYLVLFLCLLYVRPRDPLHLHTWTVTGSVVFEHADSEGDPNINDVLVRVVPPRLALMNQGVFSWEIPVLEDSGGGHQFPDLQIDLRDYRGVTIPLTPSRAYGAPVVDVTYDAATRTITLTKPITLKSNQQSSYHPTVALAAVPIKK
jgi:hypothetical protein